MPPVDNAGQRDHVWRIYIKLLRHRRVALEPKPEAKMNDEIERAMDEYTASQRHRVIKMGGNAEEIAELRQQLEAERERTPFASYSNNPAHSTVGRLTKASPCRRSGGKQLLRSQSAAHIQTRKG